MDIAAAGIPTLAFAPVMGAPEGKEAAEGPSVHWPGYIHKLVIVTGSLSV